MDYSKVQDPCFVCEIEDKLGEERGTQSHPINCGWKIKREREGYVQGLKDIIKLCELSKDVEPREVIEKINITAISAYLNRYDIKV